MLSIEMLRKEDIDLVDKLSNMADSEISEYVFYLANLPEHFDRITDKVWELLRDETSPFYQIEYFKGLADECQLSTT